MSILIIAEAGVNHNGSIKMAKQLIDIAENSGADYVKFQAFKAEELVTTIAEKADYQKSLNDENESHFEMIKKLELDENSHIQLINYCKDKKVNFLSSPFDIQSIDMLLKLGIDVLKIPSGEITNLPYLRYIGNCEKKIILSTGMATLMEVKFALDTLIKSGSKKENITVLHCNTEYPTPMKDVNLNAMLTMKEELGVSVGYSDHTQGLEIPIAAAALGASIIEKHFTIDRNSLGPDHYASLEPIELKNMVTSIRNIEKSLGSGIKKPSQSETKNILIARKSIVAKTRIIKGEVFSENNLTVKRPATGINPIKWDSIIGKIANKHYDVDELIQI